MGNIKQQYEKNRKCNYQLLRCKKNITCVNNKDIFTQASNELKESKHNCFSHHLSAQLFILPLNYGGNKNIKNVVQLVRIFLVIILQFAIVMAQGEVTEETGSSSYESVAQNAKGFLSDAGSYIISGADKTVVLVEDYIICPIFQKKEEFCKKRLLTVPITVVMFVITFSIFYCILSKCIRCAKTANIRRKWKKQIEEYDRQLEQMSQNNYLTEMNGGNNMQSQMLQGPMFPPQMFQGPMFPPQMLQGPMPPPQKNQEKMSPPQKNQEKMSSPQKNQEKMSPPQMNQGSMLLPQMQQGSMLLPQMQQGSMLLPQMQQRSMFPPQMHQEPMTSPQKNQETMSSPQMHQESMSSPQKNQESMFPPQMHQRPMFPPQMFQGQAQSQMQQALKQQHELQEEKGSEDYRKSGDENSNKNALQVVYQTMP